MPPAGWRRWRRSPPTSRARCALCPGAPARAAVRRRPFDLVLSGHLLFTYPDHMDEAAHLAALRELVRVSRHEVRVFPLVDTTATPSPYLDRLRRVLESDGATSPRSARALPLPARRRHDAHHRRPGPAPAPRARQNDHGATTRISVNFSLVAHPWSDERDAPTASNDQGDHHHETTEHATQIRDRRGGDRHRGRRDRRPGIAPPRRARAAGPRRRRIPAFGHGPWRAGGLHRRPVAVRRHGRREARHHHRQVRGRRAVRARLVHTADAGRDRCHRPAPAPPREAAAFETALAAKLGRQHDPADAAEDAARPARS